MWQIWLIIAGFCLIIEIMTVGFLIFWFAIGALLAMLTSLFTSNLIIQTSIFIGSSTILIFATKPFVQKFINNKDEIKTNVYSTVGKTGIVTKAIDSIESHGQVKVNGETWSALGLNDMNIPEGTQVEIKEIKGVKAIVAPLPKSN
ncbi:MAG: NfeD family protein [Clostridia bacterium]|nr:NfeD family protein [Clostridia bacterium]